MWLKIDDKIVLQNNFFLHLGLCVECSVKLNYCSQKREVKRQKCLKRLGTNSNSNNDVPTTSSNLESDNQTEIDSSTHEMETSTENTSADKSNIWKEKPTEDVEKTREKEFEEYLADLFMWMQLRFFNGIYATFRMYKMILILKL